MHKIMSRREYDYCKLNRLHHSFAWWHKLGAYWNFQLEFGWCNFWWYACYGFNHNLHFGFSFSNLAYHFTIYFKRTFGAFSKREIRKKRRNCSSFFICIIGKLFYVTRAKKKGKSNRLLRVFTKVV